jgi:hypothetical protein
MDIDNGFGIVSFRGRSTGGNAEIVNHLDGMLGFDSIGPQQDGIVTIGSIRNDGRMFLGDQTKLVVRRNFRLDVFPQGELRFELGIHPDGNTRVGNIVVRGKTRLAGDLIVNARDTPVNPGHYRLITAVNGLTGRFHALRFIDLPANRRARLAYSGNAVNLIVERK